MTSMALALGVAVVGGGLCWQCGCFAERNAEDGRSCSGDSGSPSRHEAWMPPEVEVAVERTARPAADTKATATAAAKLRNELTPLSLWDLLVRARDAGVAQSKLDTAMEGQAPKRAVLALVVDHSTAAEPAHPDDSCITAARKGDVAAVKQAIAAGAGFEATGAGEMTALMHAASAGQLEVLRVLVAEAAPELHRQLAMCRI